MKDADIPTLTWFQDRQTKQVFRVIAVYKETVRIEEENVTGSRVVNRLMLEGQLERKELMSIDRLVTAVTRKPLKKIHPAVRRKPTPKGRRR